MPRPAHRPPTARRRAARRRAAAGLAAAALGFAGVGADAAAGPPSAVRVSRGAMARLRAGGDPGRNFETNQIQTGTDPATAPRPGGVAAAGPQGGGTGRDDAPGEGARPPAPVFSPAPELAPTPASAPTPAATAAGRTAAEPVAVPDGWVFGGPGVTARDWRWVVVHHTAADAGSVESIGELHRARVTPSGVPWRGVGYHFVVGNGNGMPDGAVEPTFRWRGQLAGAHAGVRSHNRRGVGVALVGDFTTADPTPAQLAAAARLVAFLRAEYDIPADRVVGHGDVKATACPGDRLPLDALRGDAPPSSPFPPAPRSAPVLSAPSVAGPPGTHDAP